MKLQLRGQKLQSLNKSNCIKFCDLKIHSTIRVNLIFLVSLDFLVLKLLQEHLKPQKRKQVQKLSRRYKIPCSMFKNQSKNCLLLLLNFSEEVEKYKRFYKSHCDLQIHSLFRVYLIFLVFLDFRVSKLSQEHHFIWIYSKVIVYKSCCELFS